MKNLKKAPSIKTRRILKMNKKLIKFHYYWLKFQSRKFSYADYNFNIMGNLLDLKKPGELSVTKTEVLTGQLTGPNKNQEQHLCWEYGVYI